MTGRGPNPVEPGPGIVFAWHSEGGPGQLLCIETVGTNLGIVLAFWQSPWAPRVLTGKLIPKATLVMIVNSEFTYG